jgi:hypothetical protein
MTSKVQEFIDEFIFGRDDLSNHAIDRAEAYRLTYMEATNERMHLDLMLRCLEFSGVTLTDETGDPGESWLIAEQMSCFDWFPDLRMLVVTQGTITPNFEVGTPPILFSFFEHSMWINCLHHTNPHYQSALFSSRCHGARLEHHLRRLPI